MRRHHHYAVALVRQVDVVDIAAAAGDEARVLDPGHRLTDAELVHAFLQFVVRHPEVAAKRPSKETAEAPTEIGLARFRNVCWPSRQQPTWMPSPFEARSARTSG